MIRAASRQEEVLLMLELLCCCAVAHPQVVVLPELLEAFQDHHARTQDGGDPPAPSSVHEREDRYGASQDKLGDFDLLVASLIVPTLLIVPVQLVVQARP